MLRGLGRQISVFWLAILGYWVFGVPCGAILTFIVDLGVVGIWWDFAIGICMTSIIGICFLRRGGLGPRGHENAEEIVLCYEY